jgi:hypothetical protein
MWQAAVIAFWSYCGRFCLEELREVMKSFSISSPWAEI